MFEKNDLPSSPSQSFPIQATFPVETAELPPKENLNLWEYWAVIRKHIWGIVGLAISVSFLVYLILLSKTPIYRATSTLILEPKSQKITAVEELYAIDTSRNEYFQTQIEILKSRSLARRVIDKLKLAETNEFKSLLSQTEAEANEDNKAVFGAPNIIKLEWRSWLPIRPPRTQISDKDISNPVDALIDEFLNSLQITPIRNTQLIQISFESPNPELAMRIANQVGQAYIDIEVEDRTQNTQKASQWLTDRVEELKKSLIESEKRLNDYLESQGLVNVSKAKGESSGVLSLSTSELSDLISKQTDARKERLMLEAMYKQVAGLHGKLPKDLETIPAVFGDPTIRELKTQENEALAHLNQIVGRYGPQHPERIAAELKLSSIQFSLGKQIDSVVAGLWNQLETARNNEAALAQNINQVKANVQTITRKDSKVAELQREVDSNRNLYELLFKRLKETSEVLDITQPNARILDQAILPNMPIKPNKHQGTLIAFIIAALGGVGMAFLLEQLDNSIRNSEEVEEKLGLPFLGLLPLVKIKRADHGTKLFLDDGQSVFAESVRTIRTSVVFSILNDPRRVLLVTSSLPDEGKSTVASNLACALGQMKRVLLIDADLRKPSLGKIFGISETSPGLSNLIAQTSEIDECIRRPENTEIDLLPAGQIPSNPLELLSSQYFYEIIERLRDAYDILIIDSPPTQLVSDSLIISRLSSAIIFVARAGQTPIHVIRKAIRRLSKVQPHLAGVVLNYVDINKSHQHYSSSYYESYRYSNPKNSLQLKPSSSATSSSDIT